MRQLKKPAAQAIEKVDSDDEIDDMPFLAKAKGGVKRSTNATADGNASNRNNANTRGGVIDAAEYYPDRKPITGASKLSEQSNKVH